MRPTHEGCPMMRYSPQVAALCHEAYDRGDPATKTVAAFYGISDIAARGRITHARRDGLDVPYERQPKKPKSARIEHLALECECGETFRIDRPIELFRHTHAEHRRRPTLDERTPRLKVHA